MELSLKLYKLIDGVAIPFPNAEYQATLVDYSYSAKRMGNAPSITATLKYAECLDGKWDDNIYLEFRGERYLLKNTPTSSYDSSAIVHMYNVEFVSERVVLESVYFFDVVKEDTSDDLPASNSSNFSFFGDVTQFAKRLQRSMAWSGINYSVVVDEDVALEEKLYESQDQYISAALQTMYEVYKVPYYFVGEVIHIGYAQHIYKEVLKYGVENSLISISKNNAGNELINRVTGVGSDRNITYYYPNPTPKGYLTLGGNSAGNYRIINPKKFANAVDLDRSFSLTVAQSEVTNSYVLGYKGWSLSTLNQSSDSHYISDIIIERYDNLRSYKIEISGIADNGGSRDILPLYVVAKLNNATRVSLEPYIVDSFLYIGEEEHKLSVIYNDSSGTNTFQTDTVISYEGISFKVVIYANGVHLSKRDELYLYEYSEKDSKWPICRNVLTEMYICDQYAVATDIEVNRNAPGHIYIKNSFSQLSIASTTLSSNFVSGTVLSGEEEVSIALIQTDDTIYCGNLESGNYTVKCYYTLPYPFTPQTVTVSSQSVNKGRWQYIDDNSFVDFTEAGLAAVDGYTPINGDTLKQMVDRRVTVQNNLMPSIYRETDGASRFYNAENGQYKDENGNDIVFAKEYSSSRPREFIYSDEEIFPSIEEMTNGVFEPIDEIIDVAFDENDNDDIYPVGHEDEGKYIHPYFFVKLRRFSGEHGFNLFDHAIEGQAMTVSMKTGKCGGCNFNIGVDEATGTFNPVQVDDNGDLVKDDEGNIMLGPKQERQNDTSKYEVWLALKKEEQTFGVIMPNVANSYRPVKGDKFVLLNIDLPEAYVTAAEKRLERAAIKYMAESNAPKFNFSAKLSRIFFAENEAFASSISENCKINVEFCGEVKELYISSIKYRVDNKPLPEVTIELDDEIKVLKGALSKGFDGLKAAMSDNFRKFTGTVYEAQDAAVTAKKQATDAKKQTLLVSETTLTLNKNIREVGEKVAVVDNKVVTFDDRINETKSIAEKAKEGVTSVGNEVGVIRTEAIAAKKVAEAAQTKADEASSNITTFRNESSVKFNRIDLEINRLGDNVGNLEDKVGDEYNIWFEIDSQEGQDPTLSNYPAIEWTTDDEYFSHDRDLYYSISLGRAWRFRYNEEAPFWEEITDADTITALTKAKEALDKAENALKGVNDLEFIKGVFSEDEILEEKSVILSKLLAVKDDSDNVTAGIYGGGAEPLDKEGYKDASHGTLMMFAGADGATQVSESDFRVYEDGTIYARSGVFGGLIKRTVTTVTPENIYKYAIYSITEPKAVVDLSKIGANIYFRGFTESYWMNINGLSITSFELPYYSEDGEPSVSVGYTKEDLIGLIGTKIILRVDDGLNSSLCFSVRRFNDGDFSFECLALQKGTVAIAECMIGRSSVTSHINIGWDIKIV